MVTASASAPVSLPCSTHCLPNVARQGLPALLMWCVLVCGNCCVGCTEHHMLSDLRAISCSVDAAETSDSDKCTQCLFRSA